MTDRKKILKELELAAAKLGIKVRYDELDGGEVRPCGGLCKVKGHYLIVLDRRLRDRDRIERLCEALSGFDLSQAELSDQARKALADLSGRGQPKQ